MARYFALCMLITNYYDCQNIVPFYNCEIYACQCTGEKHMPSLRLPGYTFHQFVIIRELSFFYQNNNFDVVKKKRLNKTCCTSLLGDFLEGRIKKL